MNSFYGGKKGAPFIIVQSYKTVEAMSQDFVKGVHFTTVQFDEYVIINTVIKNDPDNGRIYRRGYDLNAKEEDPKSTKDPKEERFTGGGIYVGTIVGPAGYAPHFNLTTMADVEQKKNDWDEQTWSVRKGEGKYAPTVNLVPGFVSKDGTSVTDGTFTDDIKWNYISIRDPNYEDTNVYVGFKIPYTVFNYTANSVSPYYNRSNNNSDFINQNLIDRQEISKNHPFYEYWDLKIPKGIKGDAFKNFRIIEAKSNDNIQSYDGQTDDRTNSRKILVYDYYHYDANESGEPVSIYLGDYNMVSNIDMNDEGTITIDYTHDDTLTLTKKVDWIKKVELDSATGVFKITYNNDTVAGANAESNKAYTTTLRWVNSAEITNDGSLELSYTTGDPVTTSNNKLKWITGIILDSDGTLTISYNNGSSDTVFSKTIKWITGVSLADDGTLTVGYNNGEAASVFDKKVKWIDDITSIDDGTLTVSYNTGAPKVFSKALTRVTDATLTDAGEFSMTFNNDTVSTLTKTIKWVSGMQINDESKKLQVKYNTDTNTWVDLGYVRDYSGFLLGKIIDNSSLTSITNGIDYLNTAYSGGFTGADLTKVAIIKIGNSDCFFGFDYYSTPNTWKYIGSLYDSMPTNIVTKDNNTSQTQALKNSLEVGGIWFIEEDS